MHFEAGELVFRILVFSYVDFDIADVDFDIADVGFRFWWTQWNTCIFCLVEWILIIFVYFEAENLIFLILVFSYMDFYIAYVDFWILINTVKYIYLFTVVIEQIQITLHAFWNRFSCVRCWSILIEINVV